MSYHAKRRGLPTSSSPLPPQRLAPQIRFFLCLKATFKSLYTCFAEFCGSRGSLCASLWNAIQMTGCTLSVPALRRVRQSLTHTDYSSGVENAVSGVGSYQCSQIVEETHVISCQTPRPPIFKLSPPTPTPCTPNMVSSLS